MAIAKYIINTVFFILFIELTGSWILLDINNDQLIINYYLLINGLLEITFISLFLYKIYGIEGIIPPKTFSIYYLLAFFIGGCYIFIQTPLNLIYNLIFNTDYHIIYNFGMKKTWSLNSFTIVLFAPISEELFFRNYIQKELQKNYNPFIAIGVASLLFALIHLPYTALYFGRHTFNIHQSYIALFGGLIAGILYYKSKSILPSIIFHIMWNFMFILR